MKETISVRIPKTLLKDIDALADDVGRTRSNYIAFVLSSTIPEIKKNANQNRKVLGKKEIP